MKIKKLIHTERKEGAFEPDHLIFAVGFWELFWPFLDENFRVSILLPATLLIYIERCLERTCKTA